MHEAPPECVGVSREAWVGRVEAAGSVDRAVPEALVAERRGDPYWLPWRFETPPGDSDELHGSLRGSMISESCSASAESITGQSILSGSDKKRGLRCRMAEVMTGFIY